MRKHNPGVCIGERSDALRLRRIEEYIMILRIPVKTLARTERELSGKSVAFSKVWFLYSACRLFVYILVYFAWVSVRICVLDVCVCVCVRAYLCVCLFVRACVCVCVCTVYFFLLCLKRGW